MHRYSESGRQTSNVYTATIRKVDNLFVAGKMEPIAMVFSPTDSEFEETKSSLENYLLQLYFKKSKFTIIHLSLSAFPRVLF